MTEAEKRLWRHLRELRIPGTHFRRQVPIGPYVVDFCCHSAKLVIEVDGGQHNEATEVQRDAVRTAWLSSRGYRVLRLWNNEVLGNSQGVLESIIDALNTPTPDPSPQGGGGQISG
jgi:very-short-patch-repair endonuclease